jgi:type VI secretion system protein ImpI
MALGFRVSFSSGVAGINGERVCSQLPIRFGRNALNQCQILHPYVSDFHATVELIDNALCIRDLNSKNGVFLPSRQRIPANVPTPFDTAGPISFILGSIFHVKVEPFALDRQVGQRASEACGTVLGNRAVLQSGSLPPPPGAYASPQPGVPPPGYAPSQPPFPPPGGSMVQPPLVDAASNAAYPGRGGSPSLAPPQLPALPYGSGGAAAPPQYPAAAPVGDQRARPVTNQINLSVSDMAMLGLRELAHSLVPGAPLQTTGDIARLLTKIHDTVEMFCRCFVPMREGYSQFISSMDLRRAATQRSLNRSRTALLVDQARDPAAVAAALIDWRNQDFDAPQVVEEIFTELMMHQLALVDGIMRGVEALLEELSPARVERLFDEERPAGVSAMLGRHRALWQTFVRHHEELKNETRLFELVFGADFAESYREYLATHKTTTR